MRTISSTAVVSLTSWLFALRPAKYSNDGRRGSSPGSASEDVDRTRTHCDHRDQRDDALHHHQHLCARTQRKHVGRTERGRGVERKRKIVGEDGHPVGGNVIVGIAARKGEIRTPFPAP